MFKVLHLSYLFVSALFLVYLALPSQKFPSQPPDSIQSTEPADTETQFRRAFFTNFQREEAVKYYMNNFTLDYFGMNLSGARLNYPPEEAGTIIRDQTRSTFLEEIAIPFRESFFVNGFEPKEEKDAIMVDGRNWRQKLTVRLVGSSPWARIVTGLLIITAFPVLIAAWKYSFEQSFGIFRSKKWTFQ